jgi:tetratricopeptide (TPR) repeat protein
MEYVKAAILGDSMAAQEGPIPVERFGPQALAILKVIEVAHRQGFIHCDLKPENIFVDESFGAKLFDFGLVRKVGSKPADSTKEEAPAGTPEYMSPEQCEGRVDIDVRSDLYALGVIFYEMLAGGPPFWGKPAEVQQSHRSRRPPSLGRRVAVGVRLEEAIMRCLAKDRERRFDSAGELKVALEAALGESVSSTAPGGVERAGALGGEATSQEGTAGPAPTPIRTATATMAAPKAAAAPARERRAVALVFFESKSNVAAVREAMNTVGAQLAHTAGAQYVVAFGHELGDNPTKAAAVAAEMFIARGLCKRALVDLASVSIQARPDGTRRYQSPLLARKDQYPTEADPAGVLLSAAARDVLPDLTTEAVPGKPGFVLIKQAQQASERTTTRMGVAPLVGRDDLLRKLLESARSSTRSSLPTITTLIGEAGHGKTHLASALVQHLESIAPPIEVVFVRAKEALGGAGDQTTRELFTQALQLPAAAPPDLGRALLADRLGLDVAKEVWAGVAVAMGWAPPDHPELRALAAAPGALRSAAARAAGEGLRMKARQRPVAFVLEDAHFADETALDALEYAALKEAGCPLWVCIVGRPSFGQGRTAWASRAARREEVQLPALDPTSAAELARRLLSPAENVPATALARLAERTQGIPLLLAELVRGLKRDGLVRRSEKGAWFLATDELERLPDLPLVQWLASRETESLPAELLAHARLASLLGIEFSADNLEGVVQELEREGASPETNLDASIGLRRLTETGILVRHRKGRVGFRHSLLRDTVYQSVPAAQREIIHKAAFNYFQRQRSLDDEERLPQMAFHASRSGIKDEAGRIYLELAKRAGARHAYLDAEILYRNAVENLGEEDNDRQITAAKGRGLMRFRLGRYEDSLKDFAAARERARRAEARAAEIEILLDEAIVLDWTMDWSQSRARVDEAGALAVEELRTPMVEARLLMGKGRSFHRSDRVADAAIFLLQAIAIAETLGEKGYEALTQSLSMLAWGYAVLGRYEESEQAFERTLRTFEEHGDMIGHAGALQNRCLLSLLTGNTERVLQDYKRSITIAREAGFPFLECTAEKDLGEVYYLLGRTDEAEPHVYRAIDMTKQIVGERARTVSLAETLLARLQLYRGDIPAARQLHDQIVKSMSQAVALGQRDIEMTPAESLLLSMVDLATRSASDSEWQELMGRAGQMVLQPQDLVELVEIHGLTALRGGRYASACQLLDQAYVEAEKNAKLMSDRIRRQLEQARVLAAS